MTVDEARATELRDRASDIATCLEGAGYRCYVVGGLIRDLHLGRRSSEDVDITTDATPDVMKKLFAEIADDLWVQGERFGTIGLRAKGVEYEVTTHRSETYEPGSRKPAVTFSTALEADLSRRDFTVNAMAMEVSTGVIVDPFGGAGDLAAGILRTPGSAEVSFTDDPLRMLRAARFHAGYGLQPTEDVIAAMVTHGERIAIVSQERIRDETTKLLNLEEPGDGVRLLANTGLLARIVDGYESASAEQVALRVDLVRAEPTVRRCAFLATLADSGVSADLAAHLTLRRYSSSEQRETALVLDAVFDNSDSACLGADDPNVRTLMARLGHLIEPTLELLALDEYAGQQAVDRFESRREALSMSEPLDDFGPALSGAEIMNLLDVPTGPVVGEALAHLRTIRIEEGLISADEARGRVREWFQAR